MESMIRDQVEFSEAELIYIFRAAVDEVKGR
jgi:hypothetical protein